MIANFSVSLSKNSQLQGVEGKRGILLLTNQPSPSYALPEAFASEGCRVSEAAEVDDVLRQIRSDGRCSVVIDVDCFGVDACGNSEKLLMQSSLPFRLATTKKKR